MYLWLKAVHLIFMVAWFAGLFYLPRLFVYHTQVTDTKSSEYQRFLTMEKRLQNVIILPASLMVALMGAGMLILNPTILQAKWLQWKLMITLALWSFQVRCHWHSQQFRAYSNTYSEFYYRVFNELPTLALVSIILLAVLRP